MDHGDFKVRRKMLIPKLIGKFKILTSKGINDYFWVSLKIEFDWRTFFFGKKSIVFKMSRVMQTSP